MELTENQKAWVAALRSGEFRHGKYTLQNGDCYCCLGVLCVVAEKHGVKVNKFSDGWLVGSSLYSQAQVRGWVGMATHNGAILDPLRCRNMYLTELNDNDGKSFAQIADIIEQNAESLFTNNVPN